MVQLMVDTRGRQKIAAVCAVFLGLAAGYPSSYVATATTFVLPLSAAFRWGRSIPSLMYVASMLGIALSSLRLGYIIERFGPGRIAACSGISLALVMALLSTLSGSISIALVLCFLAGALGAGTSVGLYLSVLPNWFDRDLGRALGFSILGLSVGVTLMPALASTVMLAHGWRTAYLVLAGVQLTLTLGAATILLWLGRAVGPPDQNAAPASEAGFTLAQALRTPSFWLVAAIFFLASAALFGVSLHLLPLYADRGIVPSMFPVIAAAAGIGTLAGRFASGLLLDHVDCRIVAGCTVVIGTMGIVWLALVDHVGLPTDAYLPPILIGMSLGAESDLLSYMARRFYGLAHCAAIYNRLLVSYYLGAIAGPLYLGWAFDHLANPRAALLGLAASGMLASLAVGTLPSPGTRSFGMAHV